MGFEGGLKPVCWIPVARHSSDPLSIRGKCRVSLPQRLESADLALTHFPATVPAGVPESGSEGTHLSRVQECLRPPRPARTLLGAGVPTAAGPAPGDQQAAGIARSPAALRAQPPRSEGAARCGGGPCAGAATAAGRRRGPGPAPGSGRWSSSGLIRRFWAHGPFALRLRTPFPPSYPGLGERAAGTGGAAPGPGGGPDDPGPRESTRVLSRRLRGSRRQPRRPTSACRPQQVPGSLRGYLRRRLRPER